MLERASHYGLRVLVVLYMVGETLKMENTDFINSDLVCSEIGLTTQSDLDFYRTNAAK